MPSGHVETCQMGGSSQCRCCRDSNLAEKSEIPFPVADMMKIEECHGSPIYFSHLQKPVLGLTVYKNNLSPAGDCPCHSEDLYRTRAEVRNRLPGNYYRSIPQQCGRVCFCQATNQWVKSEGCKCQQWNICQKANSTSLTQDRTLNVELLTVTYNVFFPSSYRVFARGHQSTPGPGRLLLSLCGLGSAFVSCAGLQTHLWTTRSGTHTYLCFYFLSTWLSLSVYLSSDVCIYVLVTLAAY